MLNQPTSSPMMTSMLGGRCCCAATGVLATVATATNASRAGQSLRMGFMENLLTFRVRGKNAKETTPPRVALLQRPGSLHGWEPESNGAGPVSAMQMHIVSASLALLRVQQMTTPAKRDGRIDLFDISGSQHNLTTSLQPVSR